MHTTEQKMPTTEAQRTCGEFLRYAVVGGIAFLADAAVMVAAQELAWNYIGRRILVFRR